MKFTHLILLCSIFYASCAVEFTITLPVDGEGDVDPEAIAFASDPETGYRFKIDVTPNDTLAAADYLLELPIKIKTTDVTVQCTFTVARRNRRLEGELPATCIGGNITKTLKLAAEDKVTIAAQTTAKAVTYYKKADGKFVAQTGGKYKVAVALTVFEADDEVVFPQCLIGYFPENCASCGADTKVAQCAECVDADNLFPKAGVCTPRCLAGKDGCETCVEDNEANAEKLDQCKKCDDDHSIISTKKCVGECEKDENHCGECEAATVSKFKCKTCKDNFALDTDGLCTVCATGWKMDDAGECSACADDYTPVGTPQVCKLKCKPGSDNCETCNTTALEQCATCKAGYTLDTTNLCTKCAEGYVLDTADNKTCKEEEKPEPEEEESSSLMKFGKILLLLFFILA